MKNQLLIELYKRPQTVFTLKELSLVMPDIAYQNLAGRVAYLAKQSELKRLAKGIYGKPDYNPLELANKLYTPSYISLETVLRQAGVTYQHYDQIFSVSYLARSVAVNGHTFEYRQVQKRILLNMQGLSESGVVVMASPERAFLDAVYLYREYHFDNLGSLDWEKVLALQSIYESKALEKRVKDYHQIFREEHVG